MEFEVYYTKWAFPLLPLSLSLSVHLKYPIIYMIILLSTCHVLCYSCKYNSSFKVETFFPFIPIKYLCFLTFVYFYKKVAVNREAPRQLQYHNRQERVPQMGDCLARETGGEGE